MGGGSGGGRGRVVGSGGGSGGGGGEWRCILTVSSLYPHCILTVSSLYPSKERRREGLERGGEMKTGRSKMCKNASITITNFQNTIQVYACMSSVSTT